LPKWFRVPKGTYTRDTPDWFSRQRGFGVVQFNPSELAVWPFTPSVGLLNSNVANQYLHVIGLTIFVDGDPPPAVPPPVSPPNDFAGGTMFARYSQGPDPLSDPSNAIWGPCSPLYSDSPMPPGSTIAGACINPSFTDNQIFSPFSYVLDEDNAAGETLYWPPWDLAVIAPNTCWEIYAANPYTGFFRFDYYWLSE
jgi:hypothetical protein